MGSSYPLDLKTKFSLSELEFKSKAQIATEFLKSSQEDYQTLLGEENPFKNCLILGIKEARLLVFFIYRECWAFHLGFGGPMQHHTRRNNCTSQVDMFPKNLR